MYSKKYLSKKFHGGSSNNKTKSITLDMLPKSEAKKIQKAVNNAKIKKAANNAMIKELQQRVPGRSRREAEAIFVLGKALKETGVNLERTHPEHIVSKTFNSMNRARAGETFRRMGRYSNTPELATGKRKNSYKKGRGKKSKKSKKK